MKTILFFSIVLNLNAIAAENILDKNFGGEPFRDKFGGVPYREINGKVWDFRPIIEWANAYSYWQGKGEYLWREPADSEARNYWKKNSAACLKDEAKWKAYLIDKGTILGIQPEGLLIVSKWVGRVLLVNHPKEKTAIDHDEINCVAMPVGRFSYQDEKGVTRTIPKLDFGKPAASPR